MEAISLYEWIPKHFWVPTQTQKNQLERAKKVSKWHKKAKNMEEKRESRLKKKKSDPTPTQKLTQCGRNRLKMTPKKPKNPKTKVLQKKMYQPQEQNNQNCSCVETKYSLGIPHPQELKTAWLSCWSVWINPKKTFRTLRQHQKTPDQAQKGSK